MITGGSACPGSSAPVHLPCWVWIINLPFFACVARPPFWPLSTRTSPAYATSWRSSNSYSYKRYNSATIAAAPASRSGAYTLGSSALVRSPCLEALLALLPLYFPHLSLSLHQQQVPQLTQQQHVRQRHHR